MFGLLFFGLGCVLVAGVVAKVFWHFVRVEVEEERKFPLVNCNINRSKCGASDSQIKVISEFFYGKKQKARSW